MIAVMKRRLDWHDDAGLGVIELLVVMVLMSVISGALLNGMVSSFRHQRQQTEYVQTLNTMKLAFERSTRELRAADPIVAATAESVTVRIRRGPESARTCKDVLLALAPAGATSNLVTQDPAGSTARIVARGFAPATAGQPTFTYRGADQAVITTPTVLSDVRYIDINLRAQVQGSTQPIHLSDRVFLRNKGGKTC